MLQQLLWKHYHEHAWRITFATVILCAFTAIGLRTRVVRDEAVVILTAGIGAFLLPVFISMGLLAPQRAERSFESLLALPMSHLKLLVLTIASGLAGCIVPLAAAGLVSVAMAGGREVAATRMVAIFASLGTCGTLMMFWTLALSIRQSHEARVGLVGLGVLAAVVVSAFLIVALDGSPAGDHFLWLLHPLEFVEVSSAEKGPHVLGPWADVWVALAIQVSAAAAGWVWMLRRLPLPAHRGP